MLKKKDKNTVGKMMQFLDQSKTAFHAIDESKKLLLEAGFTELLEKKNWKLTPGGGYFVTRNDSSIIAFVLPGADTPAKQSYEGFHIYAAHSDSPTFQIKEKPEMLVDNKYVKLNVEGYGGMLMSTWFDRPLSVAGRVMTKTKEGQKSSLFSIDEDLCIIPSVAIHMNREANQGYKYNVQQDLLPLFCLGDKKDAFLTLVADTLQVKKEEILSWNLYLYNRQKATLLGPDKEFIASGRLDDLACVFGGLTGLMEYFKEKKENTGYIPVVAVFDNEEVGSGTKQGAASTFLEDVLYRITLCLSLEKETYYTMLADSFLISADNAHAVHPNQPQLCDPTNRNYLNGGIVLKYHGGQRYATDAISAAVIKCLCEKAKIPCQTFANRSDMAGGSTLGNISTAHVSVPSADIGLPQLAMHSSYEVAGSEDVIDLIKLCKTFFEGGSLFA